MDSKLLKDLFIVWGLMSCMALFWKIPVVSAEPVEIFDSVITGDVVSVNNLQITLKHKGTVSLCKKVDLHNKKGRLISSDNLLLATKVKIYIKNGCARRVDLIQIQE